MNTVNIIPEDVLFSKIAMAPVFAVLYHIAVLDYHHSIKECTVLTI